MKKRIFGIFLLLWGLLGFAICIFSPQEFDNVIAAYFINLILFITPGFWLLYNSINQNKKIVVQQDSNVKSQTETKINIVTSVTAQKGKDVSMPHADQDDNRIGKCPECKQTFFLKEAKTRFDSYQYFEDYIETIDYFCPMCYNQYDTMKGWLIDEKKKQIRDKL